MRKYTVALMTSNDSPAAGRPEFSVNFACHIEPEIRKVRGWAVGAGFQGQANLFAQRQT